MVYTIECNGAKWTTKNKYLYDLALTLEDGGIGLSNERQRFLINHYFTRVSENKGARKTDNSIGSLHSLSIEMNKRHLSYEDEEYLDDIIGVDPYTPLY